MPLCATWTEKTKLHGQEHLVGAVDAYVSLCKMQTAVFNCLSQFKKPADASFLYVPAAKTVNEQSAIKQK